MEQNTAPKTKLSPTVADTQLLTFITNVLLQRFSILDLQQEGLRAYYTTAKEHEKAALLHTWCMYGYTIIGQLGKADKLRVAFDQQYTPVHAHRSYS